MPTKQYKYGESTEMEGMPNKYTMQLQTGF